MGALSVAETSKEGMDKMTSYKSMAKAAAMISVLSVISKILGFSREVALAAVFGNSYQTDAYLVAMAIPTAILANVFGSLKTTIIPVYTKRLDKDPADAKQFVNSLFIATGAVALVVMAIGYLFAPFIVHLLAPGFTDEVYNLTVKLSRILVPAVPFVALTAAATGVLHSHKAFFWPAVIGFPYNIILITGMLVFGARYGVEAVAVALVLAIASQFAMQVPGLIKAKAFSRERFQAFHPGLIEIAVLTGPILIGLIGNEINLIVDRMLASTLAEGSISALNFAKRLWQMPNGLFGVAVFTVFYPELSRLAAAAQSKEFKRCFQRAVTSVLFMLTPMMVGLMVLRKPIVEVLFEWGAFDRAATEATAIALLFYSLGLVAVALRELLARTFYSLHDTRTPVLISLSCISLNIIFNLLLIRPMGHGGLALATSLANLLVLVPMFYLLRRKVGSINGLKITKDALKLFTAAGIMGLAVWFIYINVAILWATASRFLQAGILGLMIGFGAMVYFILCYLFGIEELILLLKTMRKKLLVLCRAN